MWRTSSGSFKFIALSSFKGQRSRLLWRLWDGERTRKSVTWRVEVTRYNDAVCDGRGKEQEGENTAKTLVVPLGPALM